MAPIKDVLDDLSEGKFDQLSAHYTKLVESVYEYASGSPTQQIDSTAGAVFGAYNAVKGCF